MTIYSKTLWTSFVLSLGLFACKSTRATIDISEQTPKKSTSTKGNSPPFETTQGPLVGTMDSTLSMPSDSGSSDITPITLYGLGLYESVIGILQNKGISDKALTGDWDGVYAVGCRPFKNKEWLSSGIQIEGGKLLGIDLIFDNEVCEGKELRSTRDNKSLSFVDYDRSLTTRKVAVTIDNKGFTLSFPNGESVLLNKLSFAESKVGAPLKAGELPMGTEVVKNGLGILGFVQKTLGTLSDADKLVDSPNEIYASSCKLFGSNESYYEAIKIQDGLLRGANIFYPNRTCAGTESDSGTDSKGVSFSDYTKALKNFGTSVTKVPGMIVISDRNPDGYARQTIFRKIPLTKVPVPPVFLEGLGTTKYVIDTVKPLSKSNEAAHELLDGIYVRNCSRFSDKTWKATGVYIVSGLLYGIDLYFGNQDCAGKALGGVSDQYNVYLSDYSKALKTQSITVSLEKEDSFILDYASGASVEYTKTSATLP